MGAFRKTASIGPKPEPEVSRPMGANHYKQGSLSPEVKHKIAEMGLRRVAGNLLVVPASKDYWAVKDNKLVRITVQEIDDGVLAPAEPHEVDSLNGIFDFSF